MRTRYLPRAIAAGVVAAAVAAPAAGAMPARVQIGGKLVAPSQSSSTQLGLGNDESTRLVQIGGTLVRPAELSAWQSEASAAAPFHVASSSSSGFSWRDASAGAGIGAAATIALLGSTAFALRRRRIVTA